MVVMRFKAVLLTLCIAVSFVGSSWAQFNEVKIRASDGAQDGRFGPTVSISGDYALVGARGISGAYVFNRKGDQWVEQVKLLPDSSISFGYSVSLSGNYALIGNSGYPQGNAGSAFVYKREGAIWLEQDNFTATDIDNFDYFGREVSLSGDYALVAAWGARSEYGEQLFPSAGYIFKRQGSNWFEQGKLASGMLNDGFAKDLSISGDYALIGAPFDENRKGSAYLFRRDSTTWVMDTKLTASDGQGGDWPNGDQFGSTVSINGDYAAIGNLSKSVYVFKREGAEWIQQAKLSPSDLTHGIEQTVVISGEYLAIGSPHNNKTGTAFLFKKEGTEWIEQSRITPSDSTREGDFGFAMSIDREYLIVGDRGDSLSTGSAYIYQLEAIPPDSSGPSIEGVVYDLKLDTTRVGGGQLFRNPMAGATVELFELEDLKASTTTDQEGAYTFTDLVEGTVYVVKVTASTVVQGMEEPIVYDTFITAGPGESNETEIPIGLAVQSIKALEELSNLSIKSDLLLGLAPPLSLSRSYITAEAQSQISLFWALDYSENPEAIKEAMARQLIAAYLVAGLFDNASEMTHEVSQSVFAFVEGWLATKQVLDRLNNALRAIDNGFWRSIRRTLHKKADALILEAFIDTPVKYATAQLPEPYGPALSKAVVAMREAIYKKTTTGSSVERNFIGNLVQDEFKNLIITTGDRIYLSSLYVPDTENDLDNAVSLVKQFSYSGTLGEAYQRTLAPAESSILEKSNKDTDEVKRSSDKLQVAGSVTSKLGDIIGYASVVPGAQAVSAVGKVLQGVSLVSYGISAGKAGIRLWEIDQEVTSGIDRIMNPNTAAKTERARPFTYEVTSVYESQQLLSYQNQLTRAAEEYLKLLDEMLVLIKNGEREEALDLLEELLALDDQYETNQLIAQAPILAAAEHETTTNQAFEQGYFNIADANYSSTFNRVLLYALLLEYAADDTFDITELSVQADSVIASLERLDTRVGEANALIADVEVPATLVVKKHTTSVSDIIPGEPFEVTAVITNTGSLPGGSGFVHLRTDSLATVLSAPQIDFTSIAVDEEVEVSWSVQVADTLYEEGGYLIELDIADGKAFSSVGTFQIALEATDTSIEEEPTTPAQYALQQNYPNPFSTSTSITYELQAGSHVSLVVYDMLGREAAMLVNGEQAIGRHTVEFNADGLPNGTYFYRLKAHGYVETKIMTLAR